MWQEIKEFQKKKNKPKPTVMLEEIADRYAAENPGSVLNYNDISLSNGGMFDIRNDWRPPHSAHSCGVDVDMRSRGINHADIVTIVNDVAPNGFLFDERNTRQPHYHLHLMDCPN